MTRETNLALRRRVLMTLRAILWHADEWLHRQELALREELERVAKVRAEKIHSPKAGSIPVARSNVETVSEATPHRRGMTAAEFDLKLSSRRMPLRFAR